MKPWMKKALSSFKNIFKKSQVMKAFLKDDDIVE
jgi:hypothetical protein